MKTKSLKRMFFFSDDFSRQMICFRREARLSLLPDWLNFVTSVVLFELSNEKSAASKILALGSLRKTQRQRQRERR